MRLKKEMSVRGTDSVRTRRDAASSAVGRSAWTSGKTYAVCHRMLAPAWPTSHAGGIMKILASVPNSSMVVAKGTPTTSNLKVSAQLSAKRNKCLPGYDKDELEETPGLGS